VKRRALPERRGLLGEDGRVHHLTLKPAAGHVLSIDTILCAGRDSGMRRIALGLSIAVAAVSTACAACKSDATARKLAGAALASFMKKCERDAAASCEQSSVELKLVGAAKTSHMKKCVDDAVGK
jgi:hypothetical protein